ncbi:hypothetical protein BH23ACT2_BH23ACT2_10090 [soil metagenome]
MFAYLDAGTASILLAAVAGGIAGVAVMVRMYWHKFLGIFSKKHRLKAEMAEGDLLGVEIDPETGEPVADDATEGVDQPSAIGDRS